MSDEKKHYTAIIEIQEVVPEHLDKTPASSGGFCNSEGRVVQRRVSEVAKIIVRSGDLSALVDKATAHLQLLVDPADYEEGDE